MHPIDKKQQEWAKKQVLKIMPLEKWKTIKNRTPLEVEIMEQCHETLHRIANGEQK